jgi:hypothetical protein
VFGWGMSETLLRQAFSSASSFDAGMLGVLARTTNDSRSVIIGKFTIIAAI